MTLKEERPRLTTSPYQIPQHQVEVEEVEVMLVVVVQAGAEIAVVVEAEVVAGEATAEATVLQHKDNLRSSPIWGRSSIGRASCAQQLLPKEVVLAPEQSLVKLLAGMTRRALASSSLMMRVKIFSSICLSCRVASRDWAKETRLNTMTNGMT